MAANKGEPYKCTLDEKTLQKAKDELFEDPAQRESHIQAFREWVELQPHLRCRTDDAFLLRFLRVAKFSQQRARKQLDYYLTVRNCPDRGLWFRSESRITDDDIKTMKFGAHLLLPGTDKEGRRVLIIRTGAYDPAYDVNKVFNYSFALLEAMLADDESLQVNGLVSILDFSDFSMSHAKMFTPSFIKKMASTWQDCMPYRQKGIHYYNTPMFFNGLFKVVEFFLKEKIKKRIHFHYSNQESLASHFPEGALPDYMGGKAGTIEDIVAYGKSMIERNLEEFDRFKSCAVDETKRPKEDTTAQVNALGGISGSFRKLAID